MARLRIPNFIIFRIDQGFILSIKMFRFLMKRRQREAPMNQSQDSSDVSVNERLGSSDVAMNEPTPWTPSKRVSPWKRLKNGYRKLKRRCKRGAAEHSTETPMNQSQDSSDVSVNERLGSSDVAMNEPTPWTPSKRVSPWKRLKNVYRKLKRRWKRGAAEHSTKAKMNRSQDSSDVAVKEPRPSTLSMKASLWNCLKKKYRRFKTMWKRRAARHSTKAKMNRSQDSSDVAVKEPRPSTLSMKASLWNCLKKKYRRFKTMWKRRAARHSTNSKPKVGTASFQEEPATDEKVKAYLASHPDVLKECCASQPHVLYEYMYQNVSIETLKRCLTEKKGSRLGVISEENSEEVKECAEMKDDEDDQLKEYEGIEAAENEEESDGLVNIDEKNMIWDWEVISKLGKGRFGIILEARNVQSDEKVALKIAQEEYTTSFLFYEALLLSELVHPNILKLLDVYNCQFHNEVVLILEFIDGISLEHSLNLWGNLSENQARPLMVQMASAVGYMHKQNIVHRDIKLANVLCCHPLQEAIRTAKIIDFSFATFFTPGEKLYDICGTPEYMAPEIFGRGYQSPPVDVWALGVLFINLLIGHKLNGCGIIDPMSNYRTGFSVVNDPPPSMSEPLASLLTGMICKNPMKRLTMQEILFHTWFDNIPRPQTACHVESAEAPKRKKTSQPSMLEAPKGRQAAFPLEGKQDAVATGAALSRLRQKAAPTSQGQCSVPALQRQQATPVLKRTYQAAPVLQRNQVAPASQENQTAPTPQRNQVAPASKEHVVPHNRRQVVAQQRKTKRRNR